MNTIVSSEITARARLAADLLATSMEVFFVGYKTVESYARNLRGAVRGLWNGTFDAGEFIFQVGQALERAFEQAWTEGARSQGVEPDERTSEEQAKLTEMISTQSSFIPGLAEFVLEHSKLKPPEEFTPTPAEPVAPEPIAPEEAPLTPVGEPRVFSDVTNPTVFDPDESDVLMINEWGSENLPTLSALDKAELDVLVEYQGNRYKEINHSLRNLTPDEIGAGIIEEIEIIDNALKPLNQEVTVFRGATNIPAEMFTPGTEFIDDAFSSTSLDQLVSAGFADQKIPGTKAIFQIDLPPEVQGVFMGEGATGAALTEAEVLLERGIRFRVKEVIGQYDGDYGPISIIRLEVVGSG